jgi:putative acetyltransferase
MTEIREEDPVDIPLIREVNRRAFGQHQEGAIVDALRQNGAAMLSLVATIDGHVVGHIMYSPLAIGHARGAALGPMAVMPEWQRQGIGSRLVQAGNRWLAERRCPFVVVLGHAHFYPRFGFTPAGTYGISCPWPVPDDVFMVLFLDEAARGRVSGVARYREEFSAVR